MSTTLLDQKLIKYIENHDPKYMIECEADAGQLRAAFAVAGEAAKIVLRAEYSTSTVHVLSMAVDHVHETTIPQLHQFNCALASAVELASYLSGRDLCAPDAARATKVLETLIDEHTRYEHDPECTIDELLSAMRERGYGGKGIPDYDAIRAGLARSVAPDVLVVFPEFDDENGFIVRER